MGIMKRLRPVRSQAENSFELIADIDKVVSSPIGFRLHGRDHRIEPLTMEVFLRWTKSLGEMYSMINDKNKKVSEAEAKQAYFNCIHALCKTVTIEDIEKCEQSQIAALFGIIFDHCTGKAHTEEYKKKAMGIQEKTPPGNSEGSNSRLPN